MLVSVIVRSFRRQEALKELVPLVLAQDYSPFELVIIEMSDDPELVKHLEAIGDPRLRVIVSKPLDPPAARNEAIRQSKGEVLVFIDDDDLPLGNDLVRWHVENYRDPLCMGVVGRLIGHPDRKAPPRFPRLVRAMAMRRTFFGDTVALTYNTLRKEGIDFLIGSNASARRSLVERVGGWDEGLTMNEEMSFAHKFSRMKKPGEYFAFDPRPLLWRRTDVPGGLGRRARPDWHLRELEARLQYFREVMGHYFPLRYRLLEPLFIARGVQQTFFWIWDGDNSMRTVPERAKASTELVTRLPSVLKFERFPLGRVRWTAP
jgi:glycosyltransferase involved in cell wall biosynthesis